MLFGIFCLSLAFGAPALTDEAINNSYTLLRVDDDNDPVGRLLIALAARERNASEATLYALAGTHPHIAVMLIQRILHWLTISTNYPPQSEIN